VSTPALALDAVEIAVSYDLTQELFEAVEASYVLTQRRNRGEKASGARQAHRRARKAHRAVLKAHGRKFAIGAALDALEAAQRQHGPQ
jgi:ABC-type sulfate transport system substrate-binding protein